MTVFFTSVPVKPVVLFVCFDVCIIIINNQVGCLQSVASAWYSEEIRLFLIFCFFFRLLSSRSIHLASRVSTVASKWVFVGRNLLVNTAEAAGMFDSVLPQTIVKKQSQAWQDQWFRQHKERGFWVKSSPAQAVTRPETSSTFSCCWGNLRVYSTFRST